ncbi:MAG: metalloregulator ArsR/SmtB family transcription factor [Candidatus ainarchaeum sp.]|jgi:ArsR family transcriptional regulator|nr:metalloregulator ArsR/SmtB family transcription factor [Candidatus ainarchaeum sp.]
MNCASYYFFTVISNETRWKIINSLYASDKFVTDICKDINEEQSKVSHNLKILLECNVVFSQRQGKYIKYSLNKKTIKPLIKILNDHMRDFCDGKCKRKINEKK